MNSYREKDMELQKLKYFQVVAKHQHITKAAEELFISQPSLTQAMKNLEEELGVPLFQKTGRNVTLSDYGIFLNKRLSAILPELERLPLEIENMKTRLNKRIRLNILAASSFVINAIVGYRKKHPDVIFDFEQHEEKRNLDIVIATNGFKLPNKGCIRREIREENIYLAVPNNETYQNLSSVSLSAMKNADFVMLSTSRLFGNICNALCLKAGFIPNILFESDSPTAVQNIISAGSGVAFWPEFSWGKLNNKNVKLLNIQSPVCKRELIIELHDTFPRSAYAEDFYKYLLKKFKI